MKTVRIWRVTFEERDAYDGSWLSVRVLMVTAATALMALKKAQCHYAAYNQRVSAVHLESEAAA